MIRAWLLTWTTYGTWLPGDERGFVTHVRDTDGKQVIHNEYGTAYDANLLGLQRYARSIMRQQPVWLTKEQAVAVAEQFRETATYCEWGLLALAVMSNHAHLVVTAPEDVPKDKLLGDFKAYGTRCLNRGFGRQIWWTERGSARLLPDDDAIERAVQYVLNQEKSLVVWIAGAAGR